MTSFLYGMLGAVVVDAVGLVLAALTLPRLVKKAMQKKMGLALAGQYGAASVGVAKKVPGEDDSWDVDGERQTFGAKPAGS